MTSKLSPLRNVHGENFANKKTTPDEYADSSLEIVLSVPILYAYFPFSNNCLRGLPDSFKYHEVTTKRFSADFCQIISSYFLEIMMLISIMKNRVIFYNLRRPLVFRCSPFYNTKNLNCIGALF